MMKYRVWVETPASSWVTVRAVDSPKARTKAHHEIVSRVKASLTEEIPVGKAAGESRFEWECQEEEA